MWDEGDKKQARREQAQAAIFKGIDEGVPAVVWDIADVEWGVIIGYNEDSQTYETLTCQGKRSSLAFEKLGQNGNNILSVAIPKEPNRRSREEVILNSLKVAVAHAEQKEWTDRPKYQNGLAGYDLWALLLDRWALIVKAGKGDTIPSNVLLYAAYYAGHFYSARCYARDYLRAIMNGSERLQKAASSYEKVASLLKPIWGHFRKKEKPDEKTLNLLAQNVRRAKVAEEEGINNIKEHLAQNR
jgi:hypothetical protein